VTFFRKGGMSYGGKGKAPLGKKPSESGVLDKCVTKEGGVPEWPKKANGRYLAFRRCAGTKTKGVSRNGESNGERRDSAESRRVRKTKKTMGGKGEKRKRRENILLNSQS